MENRAKICVNSPDEVISYIIRLEQIRDFTFEVGNGQNGAEKDEIFCSADLASLLEDMLSS